MDYQQRMQTLADQHRKKAFEDAWKKMVERFPGLRFTEAMKPALLVFGEEYLTDFMQFTVENKGRIFRQGKNSGESAIEPER